jgi:hypothetical protein
MSAVRIYGVPSSKKSWKRYHMLSFTQSSRSSDLHVGALSRDAAAAGPEGKAGCLSKI